MPETRRPSTRLKSERQSKRKTGSSPPPSATKARKRTPTPEVEIEVDDVLPSIIKDGEPLPTLREPQSSSLSDKEYKTVSESGIVNLALERSRQTWLAGGVFEKYWTKPKKRDPQDASNPSKDTMVKLCAATLIIEPHSFEITLHKVKGQPQQVPNQVTFLAPQQPIYPQPDAVHQSPSYKTTMPQPLPPSPHGLPLSLANTFVNPQTSSKIVQHAAVSPSSTSKTSISPTPAPFPTSSSTQTSSGLSNHTASSHDRGRDSVPEGVPMKTDATLTGSDTESQVLPSVAPPNSSTQESSGADPVIQMLAARAAEDPNLKALMKVVAQGHANQEQLNIFQKHIDELNAIINERKRQSNNSSTQSLPPNPSQPPPPSSSPAPRVSVPAPVMTPIPRPIHPASFSAPKPEGFSSYYSPQHFPHQKIQAKPSTTKHQEKSNTTAVVFEFTEAPNTRYLLPKHSIIEHHAIANGGSATISFIATQSGVSDVNGKYKVSKKYYQPITIKLRSCQTSFKEELNSATASPEEVRKYMKEIRDKFEMADNVFLAMRLPHTDAEDQTMTDAGMLPPASDLETPQDRYEAPDSILPLRFTS